MLIGNGFNIDDAILMARLSAWAYPEDDESEESWRQHCETALICMGFDKVTFFDKSGTQGFVAEDQDNLVIIFRGTEINKKKDRRTDLKFRKVKGPFGRVHRGFWKALSYVWDDVYACIKSAKGKRVWIGGHSLGAAISLHLAAKLAEVRLKVDIAGIYVIGCPRVGNKTFADTFNWIYKGLCFLTIYNNDIVTRMPPVWANYFHVDELLYINSSGELKKYDEVDWLYIKADHIWGRIKNLCKGNPFAGITDHSAMGKYVRGLEEIKRLNFGTEKTI
jgi:triacylglycerol lipase